MRVYLRHISLASMFLLCVGFSFAEDNSWVELNARVVAKYKNGHYADAVNLAEKALEVARLEFKPEHPNIATALNNLAALHYLQGKYKEARRYYTQALAIDTKVAWRKYPYFEFSWGGYDIPDSFGFAFPSQLTDPDDFWNSSFIVTDTKGKLHIRRSGTSFITIATLTNLPEGTDPTAISPEVFGKSEINIEPMGIVVKRIGDANIPEVYITFNAQLTNPNDPFNSDFTIIGTIGEIFVARPTTLLGREVTFAFPATLTDLHENTDHFAITPEAFTEAEIKAESIGIVIKTIETGSTYAIFPARHADPIDFSSSDCVITSTEGEIHIFSAETRASLVSDATLVGFPEGSDPAAISPQEFVTAKIRSKSGGEVRIKPVRRTFFQEELREEQIGSEGDL